MPRPLVRVRVGEVFWKGSMCVIFLVLGVDAKKINIAYLFGHNPLAHSHSHTHLVWAHKYLDRDNPLIDSADRAAIASDTPIDPWACAPEPPSHCEYPAGVVDKPG